MEIIELTEYSETYVSELDALMLELAPSARATEERVRKCIEDPNMHLYVVQNGSFSADAMKAAEPSVEYSEGSSAIASGASGTESRMVACATLCVCHTPEMVIGFVEAVVVTAACRGQHLGRKLMERLLADAKAFGVQTLHLTSNPKRVAANGLYQALGFERYETNCYHMKL